ncbi:hypothetical protein SLW73_07415 [Glutamicibacter protophormiae]|uniref:hypothetical protein n=1 Tax=Glutamicibacter protophormiae TaxID=37930 RepID=UPI002A82879B|nr:hypothetical protein [Glutamicibacter protophormiae]WPR66135.1 hypothetical protein SLW72_07420 [Glutamicibacter protophormiae]WPR69632.1 hypothetical protein SLW73_07415 [Glutamicibacter protophormiae]
MDEFLKQDELPSGPFSVLIDEIPVDFEYDDRGFDTTIVLLHPAISPKIEKLPMFIGRAITQNAPVNRLFVADPTLNIHGDLETGWFAGSSAQPNLQTHLNVIFRRMTAGKRTIYFGLSAGGFAALLFASLHPDSLAMPVNPQVQLADHSSPRVRKWTNVAWGMNNKLDSDTKAMPPVETDLLAVYEEPLKVRVVYIQNTGDRDHMKNHWSAFKAKARPQALAGVALVDAGEGHVAPSEAYLAEAINHVATADSWGRFNLKTLKSSPNRATVKSPPKDTPTQRDTSRYDSAGKSTYADMSDFLSQPLATGLSTFDYHGTPFDILVRKKENAKATIVVFHPAATGANITRPYFVGTSLTDKIDVNAVFLADPSLELDDNLRISWFAGNSKQQLQQDLPIIIRHVLDEVGSENHIFYGASAGGFAALYYSSLFPGSLAVPINPQTRISNYGQTFVDAYAKICWGIDETQESKTELPKVTTEDLTEHYQTPQKNSVLYVQNDTDWHVKKHMEPFLEKNNTRNHTMLVSGTWGNGHFPPPANYQEELLRAAVLCDGDWAQMAERHPDVKVVSIDPDRDGIPSLVCSCTRPEAGGANPYCVSHGTAKYRQDEEHSPIDEHSPKY